MKRIQNPTNSISRRTPRAFSTLMPLCGLLLMAPACDSDSGDEDTGAETSGETGTARSVSWELNDVPALGAGFVYEGWVMVDGAPLSTGRFTVDASGVPSQTSFELTDAQADVAAAFILSIEPETGDDPAPSNTKLLGGDITAGAGTLSVGHMAALGDDLSGVAGSYILNTPTTSTDDTDFSAGIWWLDPAAGPGATLTLPTLPSGWHYEGWVVTGDGPQSTGRFADPAAVDSDEGGPTAGSDPAPPFPGQDFINPLVDLIGTTAVISIEPEPDDNPAPFAIKPLVDMEVEDVGIGVLQNMAVNADPLPSGSVTIN